MYCAIADIRAEGFAQADYSDAIVTAKILLAQAFIVRRTGFFFERQAKTYVVDGNGKALLNLRAPICEGTSQLTSVIVGRDYPEEVVQYAIIYTDPTERWWPRLRLDDGYVFEDGYKNVTLVGYFGFVDYVGGSTPVWSTPLEIQRACVRLVCRDLAILTDLEGQAGRQDYRIISEATRGRSISLGALARTGGPTGDPDIDEALAAYTRPPFTATV